MLLSLLIAASAHASPTFIAKSYPELHGRGLNRTHQSQAFLRAAPRVSFVGSATPVPGSYSLRGKGGPVEDQGQCGSCWDFALTTALRGTWKIEGNDPGRLSFNYLLNCATNQQGCDGGDFNAADYFIAPQGAPKYGADGAYTAAGGTCQKATAIASTVSYILLGTETSQPVTYQDVAYAIGVLHKPVAISIAADGAFEAYSKGVYNSCTVGTQVDHMVVIEGYDCESSVDGDGNCVFDKKGNLPAGVGLWTIRNSWGTSWGDKGYITMKATDKSGQACNSAAVDALIFNVK